MEVLYFVVSLLFLQQINHSVGQAAIDVSNVTLACITFAEVDQATVVACKQTDNVALWREIYECHRAKISDEFSAEARCPHVKNVENTFDPSKTMLEIFKNICGLHEGTAEQQYESFVCLLNGDEQNLIMNHEDEVKAINTIFGKNVLCNLGKCILKLVKKYNLVA